MPPKDRKAKKAAEAAVTEKKKTVVNKGFLSPEGYKSINEFENAFGTYDKSSGLAIGMNQGDQYAQTGGTTNPNAPKEIEDYINKSIGRESWDKLPDNLKTQVYDAMFNSGGDNKDYYMRGLAQAIYNSDPNSDKRGTTGIDQRNALDLNESFNTIKNADYSNDDIYKKFIGIRGEQLQSIGEKSGFPESYMKTYKSRAIGLDENYKKNSPKLPAPSTSPVATAPDPSTTLEDVVYRDGLPAVDFANLFNKGASPKQVPNDPSQVNTDVVDDPLASVNLNGSASAEPEVNYFNQGAAPKQGLGSENATAPVTPAVTDPLPSVKLGSPTSPASVDYAAILSQGSQKPAPAPVVENVAINAVLDSARAKQPALDINADNILSYTDTEPQGSELEQMLKQRYEGFKVEEDPQIREYLNATEQKSMPLLSQEQNFPSASNNIFKASYQGSEVGSIPLFAESSLIPFGAFDARQRSMESAATTKAKQSLDFYKESAPQTKRFSVQPELDETFRSGQEQWVANAKSQYGKNWATALKNDPKYGNWLEDMRTVAKYNDGIVDFISDIEAKTKSGKFVASPELQTAMADFTSGVGGLGNPLESKGGVGKSLLNMRAYYDLDKATNEAVDQIIQTETASHPTLKNQGIYDLITNMVTKGVGIDRIHEVAQGVYDSKYADGKGFTLDQVFRSILAKVGKKANTYLRTQTVSNQYSGDGGNRQKYTDADINKETVEIKYGDGQKILTHDTQAFMNIPTEVANNTNAIDIRTGDRVKFSAVQAVTFAATTNVLCDNTGLPVDKKNIDNILAGNKTLKDLGYSYQTFAIGSVPGGTYTKKDYSGNTVSAKIDEGIMVPISQVQTLLSTLDSNGKVTLGPRTDLQIKEAKKRNAYIKEHGDIEYGSREYYEKDKGMTNPEIDAAKKLGKIHVTGEEE
jgi:hypothetical protein